jgi:energy-coupling factor transporter ATP-binding protein EcfA2
VLQRIGLAIKAERHRQLSHGEQRALEVGMALATRPRAAAAGRAHGRHGAEESERMAALIAGLRQHCAVLLIEHDVEAVFRLADTVSVLVNGRADRQRRASRRARDPRWSPRIWATRRTRDGEGQAPLLQVQGAGDRLRRAARCCSASTSDVGRRDRRPAGPQRHGQDHAGARSDRADAAGGSGRCTFRAAS